MDIRTNQKFNEDCKIQLARSKRRVKTSALGVLEIIRGAAIPLPHDAGVKGGEDDRHAGDRREDDGDDKLPA